MSRARRFHRIARLAAFAFAALAGSRSAPVAADEADADFEKRARAAIEEFARTGRPALGEIASSLGVEPEALFPALADRYAAAGERSAERFYIEWGVNEFGEKGLDFTIALFDRMADDAEARASIVVFVGLRSWGWRREFFDKIFGLLERASLDPSPRVRAQSGDAWGMIARRLEEDADECCRAGILPLDRDLVARILAAHPELLVEDARRVSDTDDRLLRLREPCPPAEPSPDPRDAELLALRSDSVSENATRLLETIWNHDGGPYLPALRRATRSDDRQAARFATALLTDEREFPSDPAGIELLAENLSDAHAGLLVRLSWEALAKRIYPAEVEGRKVEILDRLVREGDPQSRRLAALCLLWNRTRPATPTLTALLWENLRDDRVPGNATAAARILAERADAATEAALRAGLSDPDPQIAALAGLMLVEAGAEDPASVRAAVANLALPNYGNQGFIDRAIAAFEGLPTPAKGAVLESAIASGDDRFAWRAVRILLKSQDYEPSPEVIEFLFRQMEDDGVDRNGGEAFELLSQMADRTAVIEAAAASLESPDRQRRVWSLNFLPRPHEFEDPPKRLLEVFVERLEVQGEYRSMNTSVYGSSPEDATYYLFEHPDVATEQLEALLESPVDKARWLSAFILGGTGRSAKAKRIAEILIRPDRIVFRESNQDDHETTIDIVASGAYRMAIFALAGMGNTGARALSRLEPPTDGTMRLVVNAVIERSENPSLHPLDLPCLAAGAREDLPQEDGYFEDNADEANSMSAWKLSRDLAYHMTRRPMFYSPRNQAFFFRAHLRPRDDWDSYPY